MTFTSELTGFLVPATGAYWVHSSVLELTGTLYIGAYWNSSPWDAHTEPWNALEPTSQQLGHTVTSALSSVPLCAPQHWDHQALLAPLGAPETPLQGVGPLSCAGCPPPRCPCPPINPGQGSVSWAGCRISRLFRGVWDTLATLRTNLPPPGSSSHSCAELSAP